jgi:hypothetical protein
MLQEKNFVLEQLSVEENMLLDDDFLDKIHFYLQLNRSGRNSLLGRNQDDGQIGSREEWLEAILKAIRLSSVYSLSCIFYFLLLNPNLLFATN